MSNTAKNTTAASDAKVSTKQTSDTVGEVKLPVQSISEGIDADAVVEGYEDDTEKTTVKERLKSLGEKVKEHKKAVMFLTAAATVATAAILKYRLGVEPEMDTVEENVESSDDEQTA